MNIRKFLLLGTLLSVVFFNTQIFAQEESMPKQVPVIHGVMDNDIGMMLMDFSSCPKYDQLNENQKADIKKIIDDAKNKISPLTKDMMAKMALLHVQLIQVDVDEKQVNKLGKEISDLHDKIFGEGVATMLRLKKTAGFVPVGCNRRMPEQMRDDRYGPLPPNPQEGLMSSPQAGVQNNSSQGLQTGPNAVSQTPPPPCKGQGNTCLLPVSNTQK